VLFHLAAETDITASRERRARDGPRHLGGPGGCRDAKSRASVHCGSEAALLAGDPLLEVDETAPPRPDSAGAYCAVKAVAEQVVLDADAPGFATVSIRPRFVWGVHSIECGRHR